MESRGSPVKSSQGYGHGRDLDALKLDESKRIEISKRLSWVLRRGAKTSGLEIDDDGWVKVSDLPVADCLKGLSVVKLLKVIEESNQQKYRYELKDDSRRGQLIRASGKKGGRSFDEGADPAPPPRGAMPQGRFGQPTPQPQGKGGGRQEAAPSSSGRVVQAPAAAAASPVAAVSSPVGGSPSKVNTSPAPLRGPVPPGAVGGSAPVVRSPTAAAAVAAATAKAQPLIPQAASSSPAKVVTSSTLAAAAAARQPGTQPPWAAMAKAGMPKLPGTAPNAQLLQYVQQMQAMQQMMAVHAISSQYQMQVRQQLQELMKLRIRQQMHEMSYMQQSYAMQEMEAWFASEMWQGMDDESGTASGFDWDQDFSLGGEVPKTEKGEAIDPSSLTPEDLEAKIGAVLQSAQDRVAQAAAAAEKVAPVEASPERTEKKAVREIPQDPAELQSKIQQALKAAAERSAAGSPTAGSQANGGAAAAPQPKMDQESVQAKVAEVLAAARERSVVASPPRPKPAPPPPPATSEDLQAKIAEALEAARARTGKATKPS